MARRLFHPRYPSVPLTEKTFPGQGRNLIFGIFLPQFTHSGSTWETPHLGCVAVEISSSLLREIRNPRPLIANSLMVMFLEIGAITLSIASLVALLIISKLGFVGISTSPVVGGRFKC